MQRVEILLCVVTDVEAAAVRLAAQEAGAGEVSPISGSQRGYLDLGTVAGQRIGLVRCQMGSGTVGGAVTTMGCAIQDLNPSFIIAVGIAFGFEESAEIGKTILVSEEVVAYERLRVGTADSGEESVRDRAHRHSASPVLLSKLRTFADMRPEFDVRCGQLLSGEKLVDNRQFREGLRGRYPDAIGGEMEAAGLATAVAERPTPWVVVKAVCDFGDGLKGVDKTARQERAATTAAKFIFGALQSVPLVSASLPIAGTTSPHPVSSEIEIAVLGQPEGRTNPDVTMPTPREILRQFLELPPSERRRVLLEIHVVEDWATAEKIRKSADWIRALRSVADGPGWEALASAMGPVERGS